MSIADQLRRIANQDFFDKLIVLPEDGVIGELGEPFDELFNPDVQSRAVRFTERTAESGSQTGDVRWAQRGSNPRPPRCKRGALTN